MSADNKTRIIFFIGSLRSGGKERRLIELLTYLKKTGIYELKVVVTKDEIHYPAFSKLDIDYEVIKKKTNRKLVAFTAFYRMCKAFKPDIIHTWGRMQTFYSLPSAILQKVPLVNSQITAAPPKINKRSVNYFIDRLNFRFSKIILSNSKAGVASYNPPKDKSKVIYNGVNMNRFTNLTGINEVKSKYGINTPYSVIKAASFTQNKNYDLFFKVAQKMTGLRDDITFIGVGGCDKDDAEYRRLVNLSSGNSRIQFPGKISDVESLVNACDIGLLFTNKTVHGEGVSNAILEYMSLGKPVIANNAGGTGEIINDNENGYLINDQTEDEIIFLINGLINDTDKSHSFGRAGKKMIETSFSLERMGKSFEIVYNEALN